MWILRDQKPAPSTSAASLTSRGIEVDDHGGERQEPPDVDRDHRRHREIPLAEPHGPRVLAHDVQRLEHPVHRL